MVVSQNRIGSQVDERFARVEAPSSHLDRRAASVIMRQKAAIEATFQKLEAKLALSYNLQKAETRKSMGSCWLRRG